MRIRKLSTTLNLSWEVKYMPRIIKVILENVSLVSRFNSILIRLCTGFYNRGEKLVYKQTIVDKSKSIHKLKYKTFTFFLNTTKSRFCQVIVRVKRV